MDGPLAARAYGRYFRLYPDAELLAAPQVFEPGAVSSSHETS
jgi:hypothetical protein